VLYQTTNAATHSRASSMVAKPSFGYAGQYFSVRKSDSLKGLSSLTCGRLKVIHNARFERRVLAGIGVGLDGVFDTLEASRRARGIKALGGHSLAMVCERELGIVLDKSAQTSNWSRRPLEADQLNYAALDAEVLLALHERFNELGVLATGPEGGHP
jgi:hypothetical protein